MEAKQNADAVEGKEIPSSRLASTQRSACSITRRMSSAAAGKPVEESAVARLRSSSHEAAEGEGAVGKRGAGHRGGEGGRRQRRRGRNGRGQRDRRHGGVRRGRGQLGERGARDVGRAGGGGGGRGGGGSERRVGLGGEGAGRGEGADQVGDGVGHRGDGAGHGGDIAGHGADGVKLADDGTGHGVDRAGQGRAAAAESGGRPSRPGFVWQLGSRLEAKDFMNIWYSAKIINIDDRDKTVLIHFDGWNQRYDEWVKMDSDRLRPLTRHSDRRKKAEKRSPKTKPIYRVGENVYARWSDCRMYPAKIVAVNANGSYEVMYEDGVRKTVQSINVDMKPPLVRSYLTKNECSKGKSSIGSGIRPEESIGKRTRYVTPDIAAGADAPPLAEEKLKTIRKVRGCSVRVKRCLSISLDDPESDLVVACKKETVSVAGEDEQNPAAEVKLDDEEDVKDDKTGIEQLQQSTEDPNSEGSPVKRRLIHVKTIHGKAKKTVPSPPALSVDCKVEAEAGTKLKCPHSDCNKEFRNSTLVQYHIKYYHPEDRLDHPLPQLPEKRRSASSFSESPASLHEFPSKKAKRSKTVDGPGICLGDEAAVGLADQSMSSSSPASLLPPPHSSPSPQVFMVIPKVYFVGRSKANSRRMRHARKRHRTSRMRERSVSKKVINCLCEINRETSQLIQCSVCLCWQHLQCLDEEEANLTRRYICRMCTHPPGLRESSKYSFDQDWLVEGRLADYDGSLGGTAAAEPTYGSVGKAKIMKITHQLVADLHGVRQVIDSVNRCIFVARERVEPEFSHWKLMNKEDETNGGPERGARHQQVLPPHPYVDSKRDEQLTGDVANGCSMQAEECVDSGKLNQSPTEEERLHNVGDGVMEHPGDRAAGGSMIDKKDAEVDGATELSSCSAIDAMTLRSTAVPCDNLPGGRMLTETVQSTNKTEAAMCYGGKLLNEVDRKSNGTESKVQGNASDHLLEDAGGRETEDETVDDLSESATSSADEGEEEAEEIDSCQNHLLHYISQLQDGIEESIATIEEQVSALESAEGNGNSMEDILRDLPRVKKTLNQLMTDVGKVQRMSFCQ